MNAAKIIQDGADLDDLSPEDKIDAAQRYVAVDSCLRHIVRTALAAVCVCGGGGGGGG
jgi:hypothetical protein